MGVVIALAIVFAAVALVILIVRTAGPPQSEPSKTHPPEVLSAEAITRSVFWGVLGALAVAYGLYRLFQV